MAEVAVATALGLIQIITPLVSQLNLQADHVEMKDINSMRGWLSAMQAFMEDSGDGRQRSKSQTDLLQKVRIIAYDIEDVIDDFLLHSPPYTFHHYRLTRWGHTLAHTLRHRFPLRGLSEKIATIRKDIEDITTQTAAFGDRSSSHSHSPSSGNGRAGLHPMNRLLLDDEMVGYETAKADFMRRLVDPREKKLVRLAVDGPGGSGKTTLVKNVFWKPEIQAQFDCHAWVRVSDQNSDIETISENLLRQLCASRKESCPDDGLPVLERLHEYLLGKRYLVVLDDVLKNEDYWTQALPDSSPAGSRIVVTTQHSNVSISICDRRYTLPGLEYSDQWKLFCRKAFPNINGECPSELKDTCKKIVVRCEGLPLAIVTVAGALANRPHIHSEWERFHTNFGSEIRCSSSLTPINNALLRSYLDLSTTLKCCFLYFSIFPEDYSVERGRLIRLWVAERFAVETEDYTAEDVAEDYLNELIQRNLVHVSSLDFDGRPRSCRVQNIVLKFIIQKCKDENFASIFPSENTSQSHSHTIQNQSHMIRRLSVHDHSNHLPRHGDFASIRSMFLLRLGEICSSDFEKNLKKLKLIKVLDVQGAPITEFPKEITRFTLVRYLSFRDTKIKFIPSSIEKLSYLETLDLKQTDVTELPKEISHLQNLCHLLAYKYNVRNYVEQESVVGVKLHEGIDKLTNMQSLSLVKVGPKGRILTDLKALIQLRKLGVTGLKRRHGKDLCAAVEAMKNLKTLDVCSATKEEYIELEGITNPPNTLKRLYMKGRLEKLPSWISKLDYLVRLSLKWSKLRDSPLQSLERLRNLTELQLVDCFSGGELTFEACGFKKLKILVVEDLSNLNMIVIESGAMPDLKQMSFRKCPQMKMLLGVEKLSKVEELTLYDMAAELVGRLRRNGEDREWVKHVPLIHSFTLKTHSWSLENLSDSVFNEESLN